MQRDEFISLEIQDGLGNECTVEIAEKIFEYARENALVDSDNQNNWDWTDTARETFSSHDGYYDEAEGYEFPASVNLVELYQAAAL